MSETHWKQNFNFKYTGAYELRQGETKTLTIKRTCNEEVMSTSGQKQMCFVAHFEGQSKPMVLNKTNCKTISKLYTPIVENWIGKQIVVESQSVKAFGETVDALRVKATFPTQKKIDITIPKQILEACVSLNDLKSTYLSLSKEEQAATVQIKDAVKKRLSEVTN